MPFVGKLTLTDIRIGHKITFSGVLSFLRFFFVVKSGYVCESRKEPLKRKARHRDGQPHKLGKSLKVDARSFICTEISYEIIPHNSIR